MSTIQRTIFAGAFALGLAGCAQSNDAGPESGRIADLEITDPNFSFATSRSVRLQLRSEEGSAPQLVEVADAEGRRLMQGAFLNDTTIDLKVPVGQAHMVKVRAGQGAEATQQDVMIDDAGRATATVR